MRHVALVLSSFGLALASGCARVEESDSKISLNDHGTLFTFDDTVEDDHHVSCGPYADHLNFWGYPSADETWAQFQVALEIGLWAGEAGDKLDVPVDAQVRVLAPNATTDSEAVALESGVVKLIVIEGGTPARLKVEITDGKNDPAAMHLSGILDCTYRLGDAPAESEVPLYDSETHGGGDD